jgi:hypothetical protein
VNSFNQIKIVPIFENDINANMIYLSAKRLTKWKLINNDNITISIGKQFISLKVLERNINDNEIQIPQLLLNNIHLPIQSYTFFVQYLHSKQTLYLAPLIGLLTEINEDDPDSPHFRSVHSFCEELEHVTKNLGGLFYVFPLQSFSNGYITGYHLKDGNWCKSKLPIPDVIYNRIHSRKVEFGDVFHQFRKQLQEDQIPMFNDRFLSKWEVYDVLMTEEHLQPYIPITKLYSKNNLVDMLQQHPVLFLKPLHGSQGRNIIRIEQDRGVYKLQFSYFKENQNSLTIHDIEKLQIAISPFIKKNTYLIQQGISFIQHQNRLMDFRVLCHKNNQDIWNVTSVVARLSAEKQFVSNIARGGETMKPLKALTLFFDSKTCKQQIIFIKELAIEISNVISVNSEGLTGELGIDIGIDPQGHLWIIEANSKPSKNFEEQEIKIRPSTKAIISYCMNLAFNHTLKKEEK